MRNRYQLVWWGWSWAFCLPRRFGGGLDLIYDWGMCIGPVEVRKWRKV